VDHRVAHVRRLVLGGEPQQGRVAAARGDHRVVVEEERALAVPALVAAIAAVVDDLAVAGAVGLDEDVAVDEGLTVAGVVAQLGMVGLHQVELAVAALDPVVADHGARRAVLEVVAAAAVAQRSIAIGLEADAQALGVGVVLVDAALDAVGVDEVPRDDQVADLIESGKLTKPLIAYIGGKAAQSGTRFSHAGAIVEGGRGTHEGKVKRLREVGATVVDKFEDLPTATLQVLGRS